MVQRVIIGTRSGVVGMWVSRPGRSVNSSNPSDFLVDTTTVPLRPIIAGTITNPILNYDSGNFSAPTVSSTTQVPAILSKTQDGRNVANVGGATYTSQTGAPNNNGLALYYKDYFFKSDFTALIAGGKIPLMHISIGDPNVGTNSAKVGDNYPKIYIDDKKIRLAVYQNWDAVADPSWYKIVYVDSYYPTYTTLSNGTLLWNPFDNFGVGPKAPEGTTFIKEMYVGPTPPTTLQTNCIIRYAVYNTSMEFP